MNTLSPQANYERHVDDRDLRRDIRMLGFELGQVIKRYGNEASFNLVEEIRTLSRDRRDGDVRADQKLRERLAGLPNEKLGDLIRALSCFFDLANLSEDRHRIRVLRHRERYLYPAPRSESMGAAIAALKSQGMDAAAVQALLNKLDIELVFTAHPTEAKRRTVRRALRRLRNDMVSLESEDLLPRERERTLHRIRADLDCLWETESFRPRKPTVLEEVHRSLFVVESLWEIVPWLYSGLRSALAIQFPHQPFDVPHFLRFGTWVGGDRDGNPFVTSAVTRQTLGILRETAITRHIQQCDDLMGRLSISARRTAMSDPLGKALDAALAQWPDLLSSLEFVHPHERYRHWLAVVRFRLTQTAKATSDAHLPDGAYADAGGLLRDLSMLAESLRAASHGGLVDGDLQDWIDRVNVFGFHLARLDIREDSRRLHLAINDLCQAMGICDNYASLDEAGKQAVLTGDIPTSAVARLAEATLSEEGGEAADLFTLLHQTVARYGKQALGALVISMTHEPSDALAMLWLSRLAAVQAGEPQNVIRMPIAPLFETINDLAHADGILDAMLSCPAYAEHVKLSGGEQICMIGYSDSTKDGGYLAANWALHDAERRLADTAEKHGVSLMLFHGRGGALGRGGGPAARGILSLPSKAVDGKMRITEQGEVLADRYDDPQIAYRHLEQVSWATMLVTTRTKDDAPEAWSQLMVTAASHSKKAYRALIERPDFFTYFRTATPIATIESMPIASRPSRRRDARALEDLRAIPYTFSWTQNRHMLTAFYGLGTGLHETANGDWSALREMYEQWTFFRAIIDNAELALAKFDASIATSYAELATDVDPDCTVGQIILDEYAKSCQAVFAITGNSELLEGTPWLQRSIRVRNPYVDPLNLIQIELMRRARHEDLSDAQKEELSELLRLSVQGIAAGLRTTG